MLDVERGQRLVLPAPNAEGHDVSYATTVPVLGASTYTYAEASLTQRSRLEQRSHWERNRSMPHRAAQAAARDQSHRHPAVRSAATAELNDRARAPRLGDRRDVDLGRVRAGLCGVIVAG